MNIIEQYEHAGCTITFVHDEDPSDPRDNDNLGIMACAHRRYTLGDEQIPSSFDTLNEYVEDRNGLHVHTLYLIDHSGITMRMGRDFSDCDPGGWDSGIVGVIYTTTEQIAMMGTPDEHIDTVLAGEVAEYASFLEGDAFGYIVERDGVQIDSCWGYLDWHESSKSAKQEAEWSAEHEAKNVAALGFYAAAH